MNYEINMAAAATNRNHWRWLGGSDSELKIIKVNWK